MTTQITQNDYDSLQERFQMLWVENNQLKELVAKLQDRVEELEGILEYEQDYK